MGLITSRFRENKSTIEILESIEKDVKQLQRSRRENQAQQKRVAASLLLYSVVLYVVAVVVFYFFYWPDTWKRRVLYSLPLLIFPFLVWLARKLLHWYFVKRLSANDLAVNELREKKKLILEDVMEKETYKKAKEILEKFDPARFKKLEKAESPPGQQQATPGTVVRQRVMTVSPTVVTPAGVRPMMQGTPHPQWAQPTGTPTPRGAGRGRAGPPPPPPTPGMGPVMRYSPPPGPPMPRTVLPQERGTMEKLIDFVVGDGPQNRYALICSFCKSHNGMALPEEFEYLSFRCCYCYNMNQARKMRPFAPRLDFPDPSPNPSPGAGATKGRDSDAESSKGEASNGTQDSDTEGRVPGSRQRLRQRPAASSSQSAAEPRDADGSPSRTALPPDSPLFPPSPAAAPTSAADTLSPAATATISSTAVSSGEGDDSMEEPADLEDSGSSGGGGDDKMAATS